MKNRIEKVNGEYILTTIDGQTFVCKTWLEKKSDGRTYSHVIVPKEARDICGRTYIRESFFDNSDVYEFDTKTEHRTGLTTGGWRSKMTEEEALQVKEAEELIERIKNLCLTRETEKVEKGSIEWYELEIKKLQEKLNNKRAQG